MRPVFHDPSGRRSRFVRVALVLAGLATLVVAGTFAAGVLSPPAVDPLPITVSDASADGRRDARVRCGAGGQPDCAAMAVPARRAAPVGDPIVAGFAVQWDPASRAALREHGEQLDWVIIEGGFIGRGAPGKLSITLDADLLADVRAKGARPMLMLTNYGTQGFDSVLVSSAVGAPARRAAAVRDVVAAVRQHALAGVTVDFEMVPASGHAAVLAFLRDLGAALAPENGVVSVAVPIGVDDGYPLAAYGEASDYLIAMLYDQHSGEYAPGSIAADDWFAARLDAVLAAVPASKVLLGIGQYGYHWRSDREEALTIGVGEAIALGRAAPGGVRFDPNTRNPMASWRERAGVRHTVWYLDAATAWNQLKAGWNAGTAGAAIWRLGGEDETLWRVLSRTGLTGHPDSLRSLPSRGLSIVTGDGEVLAVEGRDGTGVRTLSLDGQGFVQQEAIVRAPGGYVVARAGAGGKKVAITFDDGPDEAFTTPILDTLASRGAVASFFVLGRQVQRLPELTRRIAADGHEIGNHSWSHPDFATMSAQAIRVELAATARAIEAVTGRRALLARPPYIGDARPSTEDRLRPMAVANEMGYRIAGLEVDPKDWFETDPNVIVANTMRDLRRKGGRIILLHDAGGDRAATVAALGPLIDSLRAGGFTLTTVAGLLDGAPEAGTPMAPAGEAPQRAINGVALRSAMLIESFFVGAFLLALVLGLLRLALIGVLALWQRNTKRYARRAIDDDYAPTMTVLVPAYNEGRVIARTIHSVLAQAYPSLELIVIDDGSSDDTLVAARASATDPRLRVLTQSNAGKAAALNHGMRMATGELLVVIDADTVLGDGALAALARPLADARVGAVAGNAKVGNRVNLVTRWQAVEYVTSQNLDRRAFEMLNCVTVVPGAIGAWRRSAVDTAGGFRHDTLAEDQDLTLTLVRAGHRVVYADAAIAYTEAPERLGALLTQRFRWSFGTLQCAWKHRAAMWQRSAGALGLVGMPNIWLFQLLFPLLAPAADVALLMALGRLAVEAPVLGLNTAWAHTAPVAWLYLAFLLVDFVTALIGIALERDEPLSQALLVPLQRIAYRQVLYIALLKAIRAAAKGWSPGWGKLERTGRVADVKAEARLGSL
jgi:peptidoglycan-N-acetylglucosamine deacetylase